MEVVLVLIGLPAMFALPVGMVLLLFKKLRKLGLKLTIVSTLIVALVGVAMPHVENWNATQEGFINATDKELAKDAGYVSAIEWDKDRSTVLAKLREELNASAEEARKKAAESARAAQEAQAALDKAKAEAAAKAAADQTEQDAHKAKLAAKTKGMTRDVVATIRSYYQIEPQALIPGQPLCRDDGYCDFEAASIRIQVYGAGLAVVETTDQVSRTDYMEMCAIVFAGVSGADISFAGETIGLAFGAAQAAGKYKQDVSGVQVNITTASSDIPECRFFKYGS
jgi:hypothetical protein